MKWEEPDTPTLAELKADENYDPLAGLEQCAYGCPSYFHWRGSRGAVRHYQEVHGE